ARLVDLCAARARDGGARPPDRTAHPAMACGVHVGMNAPFSNALEPVVRLRGLRREFNARVVLQNITLDIASGEFLAIVGKSGSGKSTLLRALGGLDRGWTGGLQVQGPVAFGFQDARLLPWLSVWENVVFGIAGTRRERQRCATQALQA